MLVRCTRAVVVLALAALIGNAYCFGNCAIAACASANATPQSCHEHEQSDGDTARCPHLHPEFAAPETGLAKVTLATIGIVPVIAEISATVPTEQSLVLRLDTGPPYAHHSASSISVLRV